VAKATRIYLARHGQTVSNREGRFCGHAETELTELGVEQSRALGRRLEQTTLAACYTSDFTRAIRTAALVLGERGVTPRPDPDLRELHYGEWELERESLVRKRYPEQHRLMRDEDPAWRPPGGESVAEVRERTFRRWSALCTPPPPRSAVSAGTAINVFGRAGYAESPVSGSMCKLRAHGTGERAGRLYVVRLNDTAHLAGL